MKAKRFKRDATVIERLPNELILEVCSYLTSVDAVCAFSRLNQRFLSLTRNYCGAFDFKSISKAKFDYVIQQNNMYKWQSLHLSDDDNTPGQVKYFCDSFPFHEYISQLKVLSIINMKPNISSIVSSQLTSFTHLVSLSIGFICGHSISLLQLTSLKHLVINSCMHTKWMTNLELETLRHTIEHHCKHEDDLVWPKTIRNLRVEFSQSGDNEIIRSSLKPLSQLINLAVYDGAWENVSPDGQIWEKLITSSMPLLKKFDFCFKFWKDLNASSDINRIVSKFSTPFYLEEKHWFIQCDSHHQQLSIAMLYSLPYAFKHLEVVTHSFDESISTSKELKKNLYENVETLTVDVKCRKISDELISGNIINLNLKFPGAPFEWIYSMNHLCEISLQNQIDISPKDFIRLLKNTPHLRTLTASYYILKISTNHWKNRIACDLLSHKIQTLKITSDSCFHDYVKVDELLHIVRVFNERCQHLNVTVYSRNIVAGFILKNMPHLRSFIVRLKEHGDDMMITKEWLIEQNVLYKHLNYSIVADGNEYSFWFGRRR